MSTFGRSYQYANPQRIGPGPYSRLRVVDIAMDAWQAGYNAAIKDVRLRKKRARLAETKQFIEYSERIARDSAASRSVVQRAGILTKTGRLTKPYRRNYRE